MTKNLCVDDMQGKYVEFFFLGQLIHPVPASFFHSTAFVAFVVVVFVIFYSFPFCSSSLYTSLCCVVFLQFSLTLFPFFIVLYLQSIKAIYTRALPLS